MTHRLLKFLDLSGCNILIPVVRLCRGEEPRKQLKSIWRSIVVPMISVVAFVILWSLLAPRHKTKSGEVPTPAVVWHATQNIWQFHKRERIKELAYELTGVTRELQLQIVRHRITKMERKTREVDTQLAVAEANRVQWVTEHLAPVQERLVTAESTFAAEANARAARITETSLKLSAGDGASHDNLLQLLREDVEADHQASVVMSAIRSETDAIRNAAYPALVTARHGQSALAEEIQFLQKIDDQLVRANRETRIASAQRRIDTDQALYAAAAGQDAVAIGSRIVNGERRIQTTRESAYARPWTLPDQIIRSLACVFLGFLLGTLIAVPVGIVCGMNPTFMAAMTPFIALFKPVSPIVWLPIALIIVGGFIPDPDKHWLIRGLADLPLIGSLKINPAFMASAVTVALCSLWPTLVNTALGVASIEPDHINVARVLRLPFWTRMFRIIIPSSLPLIFAGLRISLGVGWMVLIAAELLSSSEGLGKFIWDQFNNGASDSFAKMVAVVFVVGAIGFLLDRIMIVLQRLVSLDAAAATA
jgi:nitrate/nitrite transport system permease protein